MNPSIQRLTQLLSPSKFLPASQTLHIRNQHSKSNARRSFPRNVSITVGVAGCVTFGIVAAKLYRDETLNAGTHPAKPNVPKKDLTLYSMKDVLQHSSKESGIWVTYGEGVYDITNFISKHPGGEAILMAAGGSIEPFWAIYGVHKQSHILAMLEEYRIGNLDPNEALENTVDLSDPYGADPLRHPLLKPRSLKPFNAEPPPELLVDSFLTPQELFYVRNHLPVPDVDENSYELEIEGLGIRKIKTFKLKDLKKLPKHTVTATVMCAGNRRSDMTQVKPVKGLNWGSAAIGNATWSGPKLNDILRSMGIDDTTQAQHVHFEGLDTDPSNKPYGASIPIEKALDPKGDVILAYEMNGEPLNRDHGYPVRVIVPGVVGARNVKWLSRIVLSEEESTSHWQRSDYKGFSPSTDWDTVDFSKSPAIQEHPVTSAICSPRHEQSVTVSEDGAVTVRGYAWSGGGRQIVRVDLTGDKGKSWVTADLVSMDSRRHPYHWGWTLWTAQVPVDQNSETAEIWAKAVDSNYNTQPESFENIWNLRGVLSNAYHRIKVNLSK